MARGKCLACLAAPDLGAAQGDPGIQFVERIGINVLIAQFLGSIGAKPGEALIGFHGHL